LRLARRYDSRVIRTRLGQSAGPSLTQYTNLPPCDVSVPTNDELAVNTREKIEAEM